MKLADVLKYVAERKQARYEQTITEVLGDAVEWEWVSGSDADQHSALARFTIKDKQYFWRASNDSEDERLSSGPWHIVFGYKQPGERKANYHITGTGDSFAVMSTVLDITKDFVNRNSVITHIQFTADEPSRRSLYLRIARRFASSSGWTVLGDMVDDTIDVVKSQPTT